MEKKHFTPDLAVGLNLILLLVKNGNSVCKLVGFQGNCKNVSQSFKDCPRKEGKFLIHCEI